MKNTLDGTLKSDWWEKKRSSGETDSETMNRNRQSRSDRTNHSKGEFSNVRNGMHNVKAALAKMKTEADFADADRSIRAIDAARNLEMAKNGQEDAMNRLRSGTGLKHKVTLCV
jgi:hypothetical protein